MRTFLFLPPLPRMSGGLAVLVNMGAELAEAGHAVFFVLRERPENIPWRSALPASVPLLIWRGNELEHTVPDRRPPALRPEDIWLLPEGWPLALLPGLRAGARVVLYVQNWAYLLAELPDGLKLPALPVRYLAVSRPVAWHVRDMTGKTAELLRPGIDRAFFRPSGSSPSEAENEDEAELPRIAWMPRKNSAMARQIRAITDARIIRRGGTPPQWLEIRDRSREEVAALLRSADIFLATGFPEGCPLPPLEAMASGCVVTGFSGFGGWDYMRQPVELHAGRARGDTPAWLPQPLRSELRGDERPGNGLWAADGDVIGASFALDKTLALWEEQGDGWDALLGGAADTAALYDLSAHRAALLALWARAAGSDCF
ncbi:MAG TPA: glycosyltransferase family 4 protein [Candidatus Mailhella excrementigallinarum]|nr:MAG: group 1 glycosyl transferase [Desulfovibrionaceae bacterium]HIV67083.1 glycosyltransferase family 4 protein [Candidatus Mailhella excrementigallinarum]